MGIKYPFSKKINLTPRARQIVNVDVKNDIKERYLELKKITNGIFYGNAMVRNDNGKAKEVMNTTEEKAIIKVPVV